MALQLIFFFSAVLCVKKSYIFNLQGSLYPSMKFKVSSKDHFRRSTITVEVNEKLLEKFKRGVLPDDYWDFIPKDAQQEENCTKPNKRVLSHAQVAWPSNTCIGIFILD